ncbi:protein 4.1 (band 4.1) [Anopheles darlingi]|uniref:Protein 4.1 (Band 4.1) n=1 Tax=Anopheles darlingi TaxID=43151 RepID=W5JGI4_ANODA|nr:protein 4.1 (band 4.1) [Anopheles darlingi]
MFKSRSEGNVVYKCTVRLLEDLDVLECEFQPHHKGGFLLDYVCEQLEITEKDYFGLRFVDSAKQRVSARHTADRAMGATALA